MITQGGITNTLNPCPFCYEKDTLSIVWYEQKFDTVHPTWCILAEESRGHGDCVSIHCECGCELTRTTDELFDMFINLEEPDREVTADDLERTLVKVWNKDY